LFASDLNRICSSCKRTFGAAGIFLAIFAAVYAVSAAPAWGNTAAHTRIISQIATYYQDSGISRTVFASSTVVVNLVATAPGVMAGTAQTASYAGTGTTLTDIFTITATSNGPDTYNISASIAGSTNTAGATATPAASSIQLGASVTAAGSTTTDIAVSSDGVTDGAVNGIGAGDTVVINGEARTVQSVIDNATGVSTIRLSPALTSAPAAGVLVAQQAAVSVTVTAGTIVSTGVNVTVSVNITATSQSGSHPATTSANILNTYTSGTAALARYVRNVTHNGLAGDISTSISYGGNTFYSTGVTALPGDVLEYLLAGSVSSGTAASAAIRDALQTSSVEFHAGVYSGGKDITCVNIDGSESYLTAAAGDDAGVYSSPNLTVNVGTGAGIPPAAGGTMVAPQTVRVLYQVKINSLAAQGTAVVSSGYLSYGAGMTAASSVTVTVVTRTAATLDVLTYWPLSGSQSVNVSSTAYRTGPAATDSFVAIPSPAPFGITTPVDLSRPVPLIAVSQFRPGDTIFIRLTDRDQNLNSGLAETVLVTVQNPANGDVETIRLTETGSDTGVFTGYLPTSHGTVIPYNGSLSVNTGQSLSLRYVDATDGSVTEKNNLVLIDPYGVVFDSGTGLPVNGAVISITTAAGGPVTVYGDDGVSVYPSSVISGGSVSDSSGRVYTFPQGEYRFPFISPGNYQFRITPPAGYGFPSTVATATLQALPGAPFTLVAGSRGEAFVVNPGPAMRIDIPVDPSSTSLWLQKTSNKEFAGHGDLISYRLTVANTSPLKITAAGIQIMDVMPVGFRFRGGSARFNGVSVSDPVISANGGTLTFTVGSLAAGASATMDYVAEVTAGARLGDAINAANAYGAGGARSNTARVTVKIQDDLMKTKSILMGRVSTGECNDKTGEGTGGVEGVRVYLEDGSFVISDKQGMFHFEGVRPGLHVAQLDPDSLPEGYEAVSCTQNSRFAGTAYSQFVEIQGGALWRTDFYLRNKKTLERSSHPEPSEIESTNINGGRQIPEATRTENDNGRNKTHSSHDTTRQPSASASNGPAVEKPDAARASASPDRLKNPGHTIREPEGIISPSDQETFVGRINTVHVCLDSRLTPRLLLDNKEVPANRIGFTMKDEKAGKAIHSYIGVDFGDTGSHVLVFEGIDPYGNIRLKKTLSIKRSGAIGSIRLKSAAGNVADGKTPVKLILEIYDTDGNRIPAGADLDIREGTLAPLKQPDIFAAPPVTGSYPRVSMTKDGEVRFQPVVNSGLYRIVLGYNNATVEAETYVQPKMRNWILVGLAEGTAGYNTLSGNMENLKVAGVDENLYQNGRIAFFAKGQVKGKWLLTVAYDSSKTKENNGNGLFQTINPDAYYTLYGDTSQQQYDAGSTHKLYVKIERDQFYAMFGDYDTGLTITELSKYSRRMTGIKTELQGAHYEVNAFASETQQVYKRDEIPGDGTSGMYRLSRHNIINGSEKITIEIRDRFRSEVLISSRAMSRFTDYSIDYDAGTLIFKEPIYSRDEKFNPVTIVAEYETLSEGNRDYTYGGRAGVKLFDHKLKAGGSYIHEGQGDQNSDLYGVDLTLKPDEHTKVRTEVASSKYSGGTAGHSGNAYLVEASRMTKAYNIKAYLREQEEGFGLGQQPGSEAGTRKIGAEGAYQFSNKISAGANIYRQYNLLTDATRDMAEGKLGYTEKNYGASIGFLHAHDVLGDGSNHESNQITLGGKLLTLYDRLTLTLNHAQSIGSNDNSDFPTRTTLEAQLAATRYFTLFAAEELTWGTGANTQNTRIGMRSTPWTGGHLTGSVGRQFNENDDRVFAGVGLKQNWRINDAWKVDAGVERSQTVAKSEHYQFNTSVSPASGNVQSTTGTTEDFTAVSGGATYQIHKLTWDNRVEVRRAETENKWGLQSGVVREVDGNWAWSGRLQYFQTSASTGVDTTKADVRFGLVYRPFETRWIALNRLDFLVNKQSGSGSADTDSWRLVNNLMLNYRPQKELEFSFHYGAKYVQEKIYDAAYSGYTDLVGTEGRYDITKHWDVGLHGSVMHSWNASVFDYCGGLSVGYNVMQNAWLSLGYNLLGFQDKDFSQADYTAQGPFIRIRFKFDQNSVADAAKWLNGNLSPESSKSERLATTAK